MGVADPTASETCASCHFDHEPGQQTGRIRIIGDVPEAYRAGATYNFLVVVRALKEKKVGFVLEARSQNNLQSGGSFVGYEAVETKGAEARSTLPKVVEGDDNMVFWGVPWNAPEKKAGPVQFFLAANISNDDASPFGDQIEYLTFAIPPAQD